MKDEYAIIYECMEVEIDGVKDYYLRVIDAVFIEKLDNNMVKALNGDYKDMIFNFIDKSNYKSNCFLCQRCEANYKLDEEMLGDIRTSFIQYSPFSKVISSDDKISLSPIFDLDLRMSLRKKFNLEDEKRKVLTKKN